jgi:hypothetical protein
MVRGTPCARPARCRGLAACRDDESLLGAMRELVDATFV